MPDHRCSLRSEAVDEPLAGTASTIRHWLLIEHNGPWGRDGLLDARLPDGLGRRLRDLERRTAARVLLIRRVDHGRKPEIACFAVDTAKPWLGRIGLTAIEEAGALDPRTMSAFRTTTDPLIVVCTHGRRDPCCAERGRPLAQTTAAAFPSITWESTHVGGDRFAGNLVAFPHGLYFGHVEPRETSEIVRAYGDGRIAALHHYRGRSSDPFYVQTADATLRIELDLDRIDDVRMEQAERDGDRARVTFATPLGRREVRLERIFGGPMRLTCHSEHEEAPKIWRTLEVLEI
jgi:hypothetical protein